MTVLTTAILDEEKKDKLVDEHVEDPAIPVVVKNKSGVIAVVRNRRTFSRSPHRIFLFVITLIGLLCALGGLCYGIYHFAKLGHANRHRVFCRVIEASPMRRRRVISEEADMSPDGHSIRLFTPAFISNRHIYSSSVLLIMDQHGIIVYKVQSSRQCFVKVTRRRGPRFRNQFYERLRILRWYRHLEEGKFIPDVQLLHVNWMAQYPHINHIEAGRRYHPKVAEFCKEMKIFRMVEIEPVGVVPWGGGLLPKCPLRKCIPCPGQRYMRDSRGCRTCTCAIRPKPRRCPPTCEIFCPYGYVQDENGCRTCKCLKGKKHLIRTRSVDPAMEPKKVQKCEEIRLTGGLNPLTDEKVFELEVIKLCRPGIL